MGGGGGANGVRTAKTWCVTNGGRMSVGVVKLSAGAVMHRERSGVTNGGNGKTLFFGLTSIREEPAAVGGSWLSRVVSSGSKVSEMSHVRRASSSAESASLPAKRPQSRRLGNTGGGKHRRRETQNRDKQTAAKRRRRGGGVREEIERARSVALDTHTDHPSSHQPRAHGLSHYGATSQERLAWREGDHVAALLLEVEELYARRLQRPTQRRSALLIVAARLVIAQHCGLAKGQGAQAGVVLAAKK